MKKLFVFIFFSSLIAHDIENFPSYEKTIPPSSANKSFCDMYRSFFNPFTKDEGIIFFEGDYLYWKPSARIPFATTMNSIFPNGAPVSSTQNKVHTNKKIHHIRFNMQSGYRVKTGVYLPRNGWTTSLSYQELKKTASSNIEGSPRTTTELETESFVLAAVWRSVYLSSSSSAKLTSANATQSFNYKVFDWIVRKSLFFNTKYGLSPYFGVRGAWIKNNLNVLYQGVFISGSNLTNIEDNAKVKTAYYGWGLRGGLKGSWLLGCGFEAMGNSSLSLLWGKHNFRNVEDFVSVVSSVSHPGSVNTNASFNAVRTAIQISLGINWGIHFWKDSAYFGLTIAYENTLWPDLIQLRRILREEQNISVNTRNITSPFDATLNSSLSVNGLTLGAKFDF